MAKFVIPAQTYGALPHLPDEVDNITLGVSTAESYTVPTGVVALLISATAPFFIRRGATADDTPGDITDGTGSMPISSAAFFKVGAGETISFIAGAASIIGIGRYYA